MKITKIYTWLLPPLIDLGLQSVLAGHPECEFGGTFDGIDQMLSAFAAETYPQDAAEVLFMDYQGPSESYPQLLAQLRENRPTLRVVFLLPSDGDESTLVRALRSGGDAYLLYSVEPEGLQRAVAELVDGHSYLQPQVTPLVLSELRKPKHAMREYEQKTQLSERERMLVQLAADGLNNVQIADVLGIAEKTVRNLWSALFEKVGLGDRTQTVLWAIRTGQAELR